jgi:uncharacterized protein YegP (UPF0339 family)
MNFHIDSDASQGWHRRLLAANNRSVVVSGESYEDRCDCSAAVKRVKKDVADASEFDLAIEAGKLFRLARWQASVKVSLGPTRPIRESFSTSARP